MKPTLLVRADASAQIGTGHVMRCLALAQAWQRAGGRVAFVQAETTSSLLEHVHAEGFEVNRLAVVRGGTEDAAQTVGLARAEGACWVVADGYCFDAVWQQMVRAAGLRLLVIDDYGHLRHYHADVVLNQNIAASSSLYPHRDDDTRLLLGTRFALLRQEFRQWSRQPRAIPDLARRVLVTLGGSDPDNVTATVIAALRTIDGIETVIVVGGSNPHLPELASAIGPANPAMRLVANPPDLPALMAWADVAITGGGSTSWELAFLGLPAVQLVLAENQEAIAAGLERQGASLNLGDFRSVEAAAIASRVRVLLGDGPRRREMSRRGVQLVDGHGAARVAAALGARLKLTLLSDASSWLNRHLPDLQSHFETQGHAVQWIHDPAELPDGDVAFFLSLSRIVPEDALRRHAHNLVVHESGLPHGRGWSPLTWQVLEGKSEIPITLLEAVGEVDAGDIYAQDTIRLRGDELVEELRAAQATATVRLCQDFVARYPFALSESRAQSGQAVFYPRRRPADSRLDPDKTLREQFNLLRVSDPNRYPAFFELAGRRFEIRLTTPASRSVCPPRNPLRAKTRHARDR